MSRPGDWNCRACNHLNFQRRDSCQRCGESRPADTRSSSSAGPFGFTTGPDVRPGDWYCACGAHNFASRSSCYKCAAAKDDHSSSAAAGFDADVARVRAGGYGFAGGSSRSSWKSGDWICTRMGCNEHNFASRMECYRCNAPRDSSGASKSPY